MRSLLFAAEAMDGCGQLAFLQQIGYNIKRY